MFQKGYFTLNGQINKLIYHSIFIVFEIIYQAYLLRANESSIQPNNVIFAYNLILILLAKLKIV